MRIKDYPFGDITARYLFDEEGRVSLELIPTALIGQAARPWEIPNAVFKQTPNYTRSAVNHQWHLGSPVQLYLRGDSQGVYAGKSLKYTDSVLKLRLREQTLTDGGQTIVTVLEAPGCSVKHTLRYLPACGAFTVGTEYLNESDTEKTLELLSSFALDNLSPFHTDDMPNKLRLHRFLGSWSMEGKHVSHSIEELALEKSWQDAWCPSMRFGGLGSHTTSRYFPTAALEDTEFGVLWGAQLRVNGSWQMELTRMGDTMSLSGGLADSEFGAWWKNVAPGERFAAPEAVVSAVKGDVYDLCARLTFAQNAACEAFGEQGLPVSFNEFCTTWGTPTQEKMFSYAEAFRGRGVKYLVIDAGWSTRDGEYTVNTERFPDLRAMNRALRAQGYVPGVWMEFEVTPDRALAPDLPPEGDGLHLTRNGRLLLTCGRAYWDFRKPEVLERKTRQVIDFLREYEFGYLKVDYNGSTGPFVDGAESPGEGLRQHLAGVEAFFAKIHAELPELILENCASGGHRAEPVMCALSAVTSSSDAHECTEIPYVFANLQLLMLPRQSLVWAVLHRDDSEARTVYTLAAGFLGRICLSGEIPLLTPRQWELTEAALAFYRKCGDVLIRGKTRIFGSRSLNMRYAAGTQAVLRETESEALLVVHAFREPAEEIRIPVAWKGEIAAEYFGASVTLENGELVIRPMEAYTAAAVLIRKEK